MAKLYTTAVSWMIEAMGFFSFQKKDRLLKRHEYLSLAENSRKLFNLHFIAVLSPNQAHRSRLGVTVSKKVGAAVVRNRIKRLSREFFRLNRHKIEGNWDINIIAKNMAADVSSEQVIMSLKDIFDRIKRDLNH